MSFYRRNAALQQFHNASPLTDKIVRIVTATAPVVNRVEKPQGLRCFKNLYTIMMIYGILCLNNRHGGGAYMKKNYGFFYEKLDVKILILFILRRLPKPVTYEALTELTCSGDGISYFDYSECILELIKTGHVRVKDEKYSATEKGMRNGEILEDNLPFTMRMHAEDATAALLASINRNAMIKTSHLPNQDSGCTVSLALSDGIGDIMSMELFAANEQQAAGLEKGFRESAESIYNAVIKMIMK